MSTTVRLLRAGADKDGGTVTATPAPGAPDSDYFPYLQQRLAEWLAAHPDETQEGMADMTLLAIAVREATRSVFGKGRNPDRVHRKFLRWLKGASSGPAE